MISMPQPLTEQQTFIVPLLDQLRQFNTGIGTYISSSMLLNFNYHVHLSNGEIIINSILVASFIRTPASINRSDYQAAASQFIANGGLPIIPQQEASRSHLIIYLLGIVLLLMMVTALMSNEY
jgi:hypothetical protein